MAKTYETAQHKNEFQKRSNLRAAGIIRSMAETFAFSCHMADEGFADHPYRITSGKQALKLKFIGVNIADRVSETEIVVPRLDRCSPYLGSDRRNH